MTHHENHGCDAVTAQVGTAAPDFTMDSTRNLENLNQPVSLKDYRGKWLVMFFYPLDFTFVCPTEIIAFSGLKNPVRALVMGVMRMPTWNCSRTKKTKVNGSRR